MFKYFVEKLILAVCLLTIAVMATLSIPKEDVNTNAPIEEKLNRYIDRVRPTAPAHRISKAIVSASTKCQINPYLVAAIMDVESSYKADAESVTGARGLMQIVQSTAKSLDLPWELAYDIELNTEKGACYLAKHLHTYNGRIDLAVRRYNGNDDPLFAKKVLTKLVALSSDVKYTIVVAKGDTLADLARLYLGDASLYPILAIQNNILNPDQIEVGQVLITYAYEFR